MNSNVDLKKNEYLYRVLCVVSVVIAMLPLSCNYIMQGGVISEWISSVEAVAAGVPQVTVNYNLWLLLPGLLLKASGNIVLVYRVFMLLIQVGTALSAVLLFRRVFAENNDRLSIFFGFLLYMTCPYRIYVCYDLADMAQTVVWMLLPLYAWAVIGLLSGKKGIVEIIVASFTLAGIGYAEAVFFVVLWGITLVAGLIGRKGWVFVSLVGGTGIFLPGMYRLLQFLFTNRFDELNMQTKLIMSNGYRLGEFFTAYTWKEGHPGMGLGLSICLLAGIWMKFVERKTQRSTEDKWLLIVASGAAVLSLRYFPWDFVQRLGVWALKFVTLIETPAIFWGISCAALSIVGARYMGRISKNENKLISVVIPILVLLFCVGGCVYQCNTLTLERAPMTLP